MVDAKRGGGGGKGESANLSPFFPSSLSPSTPAMQAISEKISICVNRGREEPVGNDDVSIVRARKYEMVRMT